MTREEMLHWLDNGAPAICLSAQKWRDIREELVERVELNAIKTFKKSEFAGENCALCETSEHSETCKGCIIKESIGRSSQCCCTPYKIFNHAHRHNDILTMIDATNAEIAMLDYLEELEYPNIRLRDYCEGESDGQDTNFQKGKDFTWINETIET